MGKELVFTVNEAARLLKVSTRTLQHWCRQGKLKAKNVGGRHWLISRQTLEEAMGVSLDGTREEG